MNITFFFQIFFDDCKQCLGENSTVTAGCKTSAPGNITNPCTRENILASMWFYYTSANTKMQKKISTPLFRNFSCHTVSAYYLCEIFDCCLAHWHPRYGRVRSLLNESLEYKKALQCKAFVNPDVIRSQTTTNSKEYL